jgi:glycosyltransferase involved in cell wall biosynthesis
MKKSEKIFFSVIIPTYNMAEYLSYSVKSVLCQNFKNFEIIVVDNHSKDNTKKVIKNFKNKKIRFFQINNNGVIGKSRNLGIKKSRGNWIAFLDADDKWFKNRLSYIKKKIEKKNFDFIGDSSVIKVISKKIKKKIWHFGFKKNNSYENFLRYGSVFSTSQSVVKKKFIFKNKVFFSNKKIFSSFEDFDFFLNMSLKGAKFFFVRKVLGEQLIHDSSTTAKKKNYKQSFEAVIRHHVKKQKFQKDKKKLLKEILLFHKVKDMIKDLSNKNNIITNILMIFLTFLSSPIYFIKIIYRVLDRQINYIESLK